MPWRRRATAAAPVGIQSGKKNKGGARSAAAGAGWSSPPTSCRPQLPGSAIPPRTDVPPHPPPPCGVEAHSSPRGTSASAPSRRWRDGLSGPAARAGVPCSAADSTLDMGSGGAGSAASGGRSAARGPPSLRAPPPALTPAPAAARARAAAPAAAAAAAAPSTPPPRRAGPSTTGATGGTPAMPRVPPPLPG